MPELISDIYSNPEKREKFEKMLHVVEHMAKNPEMFRKIVDAL